MAYPKITKFKPGDYYFWAQARSENNVVKSGFEVVVNGEKDTTTNFPLIPAIQTADEIPNNVWYNTKTIIISDDFFSRSFRIEYKASINNAQGGVGMRGGYKLDDTVYRQKDHNHTDSHKWLPPDTTVLGTPETYIVKKDSKTHTLWSLADFWGANYPYDHYDGTELIFSLTQGSTIGNSNNNCSFFYEGDNYNKLDGYQIYWEMELPAQLRPSPITGLTITKNKDNALQPTISWKNPYCESNSMDLFTEIRVIRKSNTGVEVVCLKKGAIQESDVRDDNGNIIIPGDNSYIENNVSNPLLNNSYYTYNVILSNIQGSTTVSSDEPYYTPPNPATSVAVTEYENMLILHANSDTVAPNGKVKHEWQISSDKANWSTIAVTETKNPSVTLIDPQLTGVYYRVKTTVNGFSAYSSIVEKQNHNLKIWINVGYTY